MLYKNCARGTFTLYKNCAQGTFLQKYLRNSFIFSNFALEIGTRFQVLIYMYNTKFCNDGNKNLLRLLVSLFMLTFPAVQISAFGSEIEIELLEVPGFLPGDNLIK